MRAFVTGGTGFIGRRVVRLLQVRGIEVIALVRSSARASSLQDAGIRTVIGDINDRTSLRAGMTGCDIVFHLAAWYKLNGSDSSQAYRVNVEGTRNVLETAIEMNISRIIYTSSIAIFGDTKGKLVDETYHMPAAQPFITEYDRTKYLAHYEVALPLIAKGAPIIIVMPGVVFGPGDNSLVGKLAQAFSRRLLVLFPGPDIKLAYTYIDDVADAHLLAAEKGRIGESYIIAGPCLSGRQASHLWARITGKPRPLFYVPGRLLRPLAPLAAFLGSTLPIWPDLFSADGINVLQATYIAQSDKAQRELNWTPRPLEEGFRLTFDALSHH